MAWNHIELASFKVCSLNQSKTAQRCRMSTEPGKLAAAVGRKNSSNMYSVLEVFTVPPFAPAWTKEVLQ